MIMNHFLTAFLSQSQAKGLNPLAKSSFAASNTTAYYSLICPDPGLMQDSPRLEQRVARGGNHFIIPGAPPELSQGIWKANSRRKVELLGITKQWHCSRRLLPFPEPLHQLGAEAGNYPKDGGLGRGEGAICSPFSLRACTVQGGFRPCQHHPVLLSVDNGGSAALGPQEGSGAGREKEGEAHGWGDENKIEIKNIKFNMK